MIFKPIISVNLIIQSKTFLKLVARIFNGNITKIPSSEILSNGKFPVITQEQDEFISGYTNDKNAITDLPLIVFGDHSCTFKYIDFPFVRGADGTQLLKCDEKLLLSKCFYYLLQFVEIENKDKYERHFKYLTNTKIPLPPLEIQHKIVAECEEIDLEVSKAEESQQKLELTLEEMFSGNDFEVKRLEEVVIKQSEQIDPNKHTGDVFYVGLENIESHSGKIVGNPSTQYASIRSNKNVYQIGDLLYGKLRPNLNKVYLAKEAGICSTDILVLRCFDESLNKFYAYYFRTKQFNDEVVKTVSGQQLPRTKWSLMETIKVPVPKDKEQVIAQIEQLEGIIKQNQAKIEGSSERKKAVMKRYL